MKALIQRVKKASIKVEDKNICFIDYGLVILLSIEKDDNQKVIEPLVKKIMKLRIFPNNENKLSLSSLDIKADILIVSQFSLYANLKKGNRPSFENCADKILANKLYSLFIEESKSYGIKVESGIFAADMLLSLENDGPLSFILDSKIDL